MRFDILTLFPEVITPYVSASILGRAQADGRATFAAHDIRAFATDKHKTVDDTPYGGGAGMVLKIAPIHRGLEAIFKESRSKNQEVRKRKTVVLSARGEQFTQAKAQEYAALDQLVLICGRYEGIDQRVADHLADEELSIGPYVLAGGEIAALAVAEAVARLLPGVLGNPQSLVEESFAQETRNKKQETKIEYPQYTKPEEYNGWTVPGVLLSGDHEKIRRWREEH